MRPGSVFAAANIQRRWPKARKSLVAPVSGWANRAPAMRHVMRRRRRRIALWATDGDGACLDGRTAGGAFDVVEQWPRTWVVTGGSRGVQLAERRIHRGGRGNQHGAG